MTYWRIFMAFLRVSIYGETAYRVNFAIQLFESLLNLGMSLGGLAIIFTYTNVLGGWLPGEVIALVGVYFMVGGFVRLIIQPGMEQLIESVRDGTLDFRLTKPADAQAMVSLQRVAIWEVFEIALGAGVLIYALAGLGQAVGTREAVQFVVMLTAGGAIVYSFFLILGTLSFWFVRVENILVIFQSVYEAGRWPVSLYPGWLRYGLSFVIPVAFATTVPVQALTGRLNWQTTSGAVLFAVVLVTASRVFWKAGLRRYSGASS